MPIGLITTESFRVQQGTFGDRDHDGPFSLWTHGDIGHNASHRASHDGPLGLDSGMIWGSLLVLIYLEIIGLQKRYYLISLTSYGWLWIQIAGPCRWYTFLTAVKASRACLKEECCYCANRSEMIRNTVEQLTQREVLEAPGVLGMAAGFKKLG